MGDHKYIWLAPKCATDHYHDDRCWCSTPEELVCEECGAKPIAYVRAGKPTAELVSDLAAARARIAELEARLASLTSVSEEDVERVARAIDRAALNAGVVLNDQIYTFARAALTAFVSR